MKEKLRKCYLCDRNFLEKVKLGGYFHKVMCEDCKNVIRRYEENTSPDKKSQLRFILNRKV